YEKQHDRGRRSLAPDLGSRRIEVGHAATFGSPRIVPVRYETPICLDREMQPDRILTRPFALTMAAEFALCMSVGMLLAILPVYADDALGVGSFGVALAVAAASPMVLVCQPLAGRVGDRRGRKMLVVVGGIVAAASVAGYVVADSLAVLV